MLKLIPLIGVLFLIDTVFGHFQLTYPLSRGYDEQKEATAPCGGFDSVQPRTAFPLQNGFIVIASGHQAYSLKLNVLLKDNPTTADFIDANLHNVLVAQTVGSQYNCMSVDMPSQVQNGTLATLQVAYNAGDGQLYQCTDVVLVTNAPQFNRKMCTDAKNNKSPSTSFSPTTAGPTPGSTAGSSSDAHALQVPWMVSASLLVLFVLLGRV